MKKASPPAQEPAMKGMIFIFKWIFFFLVLSFLIPFAVSGWECTDCPKRKIAVFGINPPPVQQGTAISYGDWASMHFVTGAVLDALFNGDPSRKCLRFVDAQLGSNLENSNDIYTQGLGDFTAPAGAVQGTDYLITGHIDQQPPGNAYVMTVSLQAAVSREQVISASLTYDVSKGGQINGRLIAEQFMPLMEHIRDFEKQKRNENSAVAIDVQDDIDIIPERKVIHTNEKIKIKYRVIDCDKEPLKGRVFAPFATMGRLMTTGAPTTDNKGECYLDFVAGNKTGTANLTVEFPYVDPFGEENRGGGGTTIRIVNHTHWARVKITINSHHKIDREDIQKIERTQWDDLTTLSVYLFFEPEPVKVYYSEASRLPRAFRYNLAGFFLEDFKHNAYGQSYEATKWGNGFKHEITSSGSELMESVSLDRFHGSGDMIIHINPETGSVIKVELPVLMARYTVINDRKCEKVDHYRHKREDCGQVSKETKDIITQPPEEYPCDDIAGTGPSVTNGRCLIINRDKFTVETTTYEWEVHRD